MRKFITGWVFPIKKMSITNVLFSNDVQNRHWDNGEMNFPPAKSQGRTVMTSDFVEPVWGFMQYNDTVWSSMKVNIIQYTVHCSTELQDSADIQQKIKAAGG